MDNSKPLRRNSEPTASSATQDLLNEDLFGRPQFEAGSVASEATKPVSKEAKPLNPYAEASQASVVKVRNGGQPARTLQSERIRKSDNTSDRRRKVVTVAAVTKHADRETMPAAPSLTSKALSRFITVREVATYFGVSASTIWRWSKENDDFPKAHKIGTGTTRWDRCEIESYANRRASHHLP